MAYKDTDFMYASARVSVFETRLLTREKYMQLIDAASEKDAVSLLGDACTPVYTEYFEDWWKMNLESETEYSYPMNS